MITKTNKVKIEIERSLANEIKRLLEVGDTYSSVIKKILNQYKKTSEIHPDKCVGCDISGEEIPSETSTFCGIPG